MINTKKISLTIVGVGKEPFEANYAIIKERVHLYISRVHNVRGFISRAFSKEVESGTDGQIFDCRLVGVGEEYDEYIARKAVINEDKLSFDSNRYIKAVFTLSNDLLRFFNSVWEIKGSTEDRLSQSINFASKENRQDLIEFTEDMSLSIEMGYKQSYSKIRYEAHSSVAFYLHFRNEITREKIFELIQAIADFYSLFCKLFISIGNIRLRPKIDQPVAYFGDPAGDGSEVDYFANVLIEQNDIDQFSNNSLINWVNDFEKSKTCMNLMRDAEKVTDEQLKFICYSRALEVFHKEFFMDTDTASESYFDDLFEFVDENSLVEIEKDKFGRSKLTLVHRLYDLARFAFSILSDNTFRLVFGRVIMKDRIQQLADTRNYLIHFSESKKGKAWKADDLHHVNFNMFMMLKVLFLKRFGFTDKAIRSVVHALSRDHFGL